MKYTGSAAILGAVFLVSGCAMPRMARQLDVMEARVLDQEKAVREYEKRLAEQQVALVKQEERLADQEKQNEALKKDLAAARIELKAAVSSQVDEALRQPRVQAEIQRAVEQNVARRMEEFERRRAEARGGEQDGDPRDRWERRREEFRARREEREKQELDKLATELKLSEEQQKRVNEHAAEIRETVGDAFRRMREDGNFNLEEIKATVEDLKNRNDAVMKDVLTAEQYEEYRKRPNPLDGVYNFLTGQGGRGGRPGRGDRRGPPERGERAREE